ncbi:kinase-like domain-containing protein [Xylaria longipes]|nr:kinase-like domain-containing protein [Xylaria longipes]
MMQDTSVESDKGSDYGDYVDWESDEASEIEINAEPVERYYHGCMYYPVRVGEVLDGRYRIVHKLGYGGFSTVWMAHDIQNDKAVALKTLVSGKDGEAEFLAQSTVCRIVGSAPHIVTYRSTFEVSGRGSGRHHVLVMPLLGPNLETRLREASMAARMSAARQLLIALKTLHQAGIVHRDLNHGAVMWEMTDIDKYDKATQYRRFGRPQKLDLIEKACDLADLVQPMTIPPEFIGNTVYLGDFGMAILVGTPVDFKIQTPAMFCAPERYHDRNPSLASDMWSYTCIFAALYLGFPPFHGSGDDIVSLWVNTLGPLPVSWKGKYRYFDNKGDDAWYDQDRKHRPTMNLESLLARREPVPEEEEMKLVLSIFQRGFDYGPEKRPSAAELLKDDSFNALMRIYGCIDQEKGVK